jgi:hypothetical protein
MPDATAVFFLACLPSQPVSQAGRKLAGWACLQSWLATARKKKESFMIISNQLFDLYHNMAGGRLRRAITIYGCSYFFSP